MRMAAAAVLLSISQVGAAAVGPQESRAQVSDIRVEQAPSAFASPGASYPERTAIDAALGAFVRSCAPLTTDYWGDVVWATATVYSETYAKLRLERYGWRREIAVAVLIRDHPTTIPRRFDVAAHTLHFALGGGHSPGIVAAKDAQALCAMGAPRGAEGFKSVPELVVIDR
jgi:hypothetical protein